MKNFNELSKQELSVLTETQVDAYIDIELAAKGIIKAISVNTDYPNYVAPMTAEPERDVTVYEVDGYIFTDKESADKVVSLIGSLQQVSSNYDWNVGSEFTFISDRRIAPPSIQIKKIYSELKFTNIKEQLKQINKERDSKKSEENEQVENAINYEAIDAIKYQIRGKVRDSIDFFYKAKQYAGNYDKYFQITNDKETALKTIFTVFNIQDDDIKEQIKIEIDNLQPSANAQAN